MSQQIINVGSAPNDGTGDVLRNSQIKANANFTELYNAFDLKLDKVTTSGVERAYGVDASGAQVMLTTSAFITKKAIVVNSSVSGTFNLDPTITDTYNLTLTGNTTLALINASSTYAEPMTVYVTGNYGLTHISGANVVGDTYDGAILNQLVIEKVVSTIYVTVINRP